jgi:TPR repeat protein
MRISSVLAGAVVVGLGLALPMPVLSLDGTPSPAKPTSPNSPVEAFRAPAKPTSPTDAYRSAAEALRAGEKTRAVSSLQYAADHGHGFALWQLGRMYAEGDGVKRDDYRSFEYFKKFADAHADDNPATARSRFVADAFVSLGNYYLAGIPDSPVTANPERARRMFYHAASYFGDPEAQYQLAMLYVEGQGVGREPKRAVPWLVLAANKGHYKSQALLGRILFKGEHGSRQPASGLKWLIIASDGAGASVPWIVELRETAFKQATEKERAQALLLLERWLERRE